MKKILFSLLISAVLFSACQQKPTENQNTGLAQDSTRIVSLNGTLSEIVSALGMESQIVGVDMTSTYPISLKEKPNLGHNKNINIEALLALKPHYILAMEEDLKPEAKQQLQNTGITLRTYARDYSTAGTEHLIKQLAEAFDKNEQATTLITQLQTDLKAVKPLSKIEKVLFIYARGSGTMMVAGEETPVDEILKLVGAKNAVSGFKDFKPLNAEALVAANPDAILLFDTGLQSLGGIKGIEKVQGITETNAFKNKKIITMDGQLLTGFGPRLGIAVQTLADQLR